MFSDLAFVIIVLLCIAITMFNLTVGATVTAMVCLAECGALYMRFLKQPLCSQEVDYDEENSEV